MGGSRSPGEGRRHRSLARGVNGKAGNAVELHLQVWAVGDVPGAPRRDVSQLGPAGRDGDGAHLPGEHAGAVCAAAAAAAHPWPDGVPQVLGAHMGSPDGATAAAADHPDTQPAHLLLALPHLVALPRVARRGQPAAHHCGHRRPAAAAAAARVAGDAGGRQAAAVRGLAGGADCAGAQVLGAPTAAHAWRGGVLHQEPCAGGDHPARAAVAGAGVRPAGGSRGGGVQLLHARGARPCGARAGPRAPGDPRPRGPVAWPGGGLRPRRGWRCQFGPLQGRVGPVCQTGCWCCEAAKR
mmetsp:Transcript_44519/g.115192  ORF Transcript_44519/g.115192 Transcript_44519/m.115192 type:complete len:296 (-) Transcript_44519:504-1391(-)